MKTQTIQGMKKAISMIIMLFFLLNFPLGNLSAMDLKDKTENDNYSKVVQSVSIKRAEPVKQKDAFSGYNVDEDTAEKLEFDATIKMFKFLYECRPFIVTTGELVRTASYASDGSVLKSENKSGPVGFASSLSTSPDKTPLNTQKDGIAGVWHKIPAVFKGEAEMAFKGMSVTWPSCYKAFTEYEKADDAIYEYLKKGWFGLDKKVIYESKDYTEAVKLAIHEFTRAIRVAIGSRMHTDIFDLQEEKICSGDLLEETPHKKFLFEAIKPIPPPAAGAPDNLKNKLFWLSEFQRQLGCISPKQSIELDLGMRAALILVEKRLKEHQMNPAVFKFRQAVYPLALVLVDVNKIFGESWMYKWLVTNTNKAMFGPDTLYPEGILLYNRASGKMVRLTMILEGIKVKAIDATHIDESMANKSQSLVGFNFNQSSSGKTDVAEEPPLTNFGISMSKVCKNSSLPQWLSGGKIGYPVEALQAVFSPEYVGNGYCSFLEMLTTFGACRVGMCGNKYLELQQFMSGSGGGSTEGMALPIKDLSDDGLCFAPVNTSFLKCLDDANNGQIHANASLGCSDLPPAPIDAAADGGGDGTGTTAATGTGGDDGGAGGGDDSDNGKNDNGDKDDSNSSGETSCGKRCGEITFPDQVIKGNYSPRPGPEGPAKIGKRGPDNISGSTPLPGTSPGGGNDGTKGGHHGDDPGTSAAGTGWIPGGGGSGGGGTPGSDQGNHTGSASASGSGMTGSAANPSSQSFPSALPGAPTGSSPSAVAPEDQKIDLDDPNDPEVKKYNELLDKATALIEDLKKRGQKGEVLNPWDDQMKELAELLNKMQKSPVFAAKWKQAKEEAKRRITHKGVPEAVKKALDKLRAKSGLPPVNEEQFKEAMKYALETIDEAAPDDIIKLIWTGFTFLANKSYFGYFMTSPTAKATNAVAGPMLTILKGEVDREEKNAFSITPIEEIAETLVHEAIAHALPYALGGKSALVAGFKHLELLAILNELGDAWASEAGTITKQILNNLDKNQASPSTSGANTSTAGPQQASAGSGSGTGSSSGTGRGIKFCDPSAGGCGGSCNGVTQQALAMSNCFGWQAGPSGTQGAIDIGKSGGGGYASTPNPDAVDSTIYDNCFGSDGNKGGQQCPMMDCAEGEMAVKDETGKCHCKKGSGDPVAGYEGPPGQGCMATMCPDGTMPMLYGGMCMCMAGGSQSEFMQGNPAFQDKLQNIPGQTQQKSVQQLQPVDRGPAGQDRERQALDPDRDKP